MSPYRYGLSKSFALSILLVLAVVLSACSPLGNVFANPSPTETPAVVEEEVQVDSIEFLFLESFPLQVHAVVKGQLPDACSFIEMVEQAYGNNTFDITLHNARHPNMRCMPQPTPFEEIIPLDVLGLEAGTYTVNIHGAKATFELPVDNFLTDETSE